MTGVLPNLTYHTLYTMLMLTLSKPWRAPHPRIALLTHLLTVHYCKVSERGARLEFYWIYICESCLSIGDIEIQIQPCFLSLR